MAKALVAFADGSEDMEATSVASILDRGGVQVVRAAINDTASKQVRLSHGMVITCDKHIDECAQEQWDIIIIPGGLNGATNCANNATLVKMLKEQHAQGRYVGAICAAPGFVLDKHGIIGDSKATGYPGCCDGIKNYTGEGTTTALDSKIVTGKGPAYSIDFGLACLAVLVDAATLQKVKDGMLYC